MGWDETNATLPLQVCDVCGKAYYMADTTCATCETWGFLVTERGQRDARCLPRYPRAVHEGVPPRECYRS
jgi:hypothetical protein